MIFTNAYLMPMSSPPIESGYLRVKAGKIQSIGTMDMAPPSEPSEEAVDLAGKLLLPGFIDAHCHLGIIEEGMRWEGSDANENTNPVTPHLRAMDGINPYDKAFGEARAAGVTCTAVSPGSVNVIGGDICVIKTTGRTLEEMRIKTPVAVKMALGENPKLAYGQNHKMPKTRMGEVGCIRKALYKAKTYLEKLEAGNTPDYDLECEALLPLLRREVPAHIHAHRAYDIMTGIRIAEEFALDYVIVHCTEGHLIADILAEKKARAICGPLITNASKPEVLERSPATPAALLSAGVDTAICTDHPEVPIQHLALSAALTLGAGLTRQQALESITVAPARILGLEGSMGALAAGCDADILVFDGDPLAPGVRPEQVYIGGERRI